MKKKVFILLPFLLFIFLFSGCSQENIDLSNNITFSIEILPSGMITQSISFPTQEKEFELSEIEKKNYVQTLSNEIKAKLFFPYFYSFYTTSVTSGNAEYKIGGDKMQYKLPAYDAATKTINFSFIFANSEVWEYYHPQKNSESNDEIQKGVFISKKASKGNFLFNEKITNENGETTLGNHFYTLLSTVQSKFSNKEISKPNFSYIYSHFSNKLHTNSDFKLNQNGQFVSVWSQNFDSLGTDKKVEIFMLSPNRVVWYSLALGAVILGVVLAYFVRFIICNNKRKKEKI